VHRHGSSVTLQLPHLASGDGRGGTDGFALFSGVVGCSQAHNEVFNQLRKKRNFELQLRWDGDCPNPSRAGVAVVSLMWRNGFIVIHQQDLVGNLAFGRSHTAPLFLNN
jgi:hypothetical protein